MQDLIERLSNAIDKALASGDRVPCMTDRIEQAARILNTAAQALTLGERIAARFGRGDSKKRATWHRIRAIERERKAKRARSERRVTNLVAGAAADRAIADVLDPPAATCPA